MSEDRVRGNWRTTVAGVPVFLFGIFMMGVKVLCMIGKLDECNFSITEILTTLAFGWSLIRAKDTLLEGITMGLFKLKK